MEEVKKIKRKGLPDFTGKQRLQDHPNINNDIAEKTGIKVPTDNKKRTDMLVVFERKDI